MSPVLINLYIDDLSNKHETSMMLDGWLLMILRALFFSLMETKVRYLGHIIRNELCNNDDDDVQCTSTLKHLFLELAVFVLKANASGGM